MILHICISPICEMSWFIRVEVMTNLELRFSGKNVSLFWEEYLFSIVFDFTLTLLLNLKVFVCQSLELLGSRGIVDLSKFFREFFRMVYQCNSFNNRQYMCTCCFSPIQMFALAELQALHEMVQQKVVTLLSDPENIVKQTLMENGITRLCVFFGRQKANDVLLSHMITFLNDKNDWHLRGAFFDSIVGKCMFSASIER